ncbi:MAG: hypothetical protein IH913_03510, partial [Proteobacteria bacterium]|nr:hypothetical protein [Pseudomonadota bacterium]
GDVVGVHVAVDSNGLIIGAPRENVDLDEDGDTFGLGENDTGAIYIYARTAGGLVFHQKIEGEGDNIFGIGDRFGSGVTLEGNWLFVGAARSSRPGQVFAGEVFVFKYDADTDLWNLTQKLISDAPDGGGFGSRTESSKVELFSFGKKPNARIALIGEDGDGTGGSLHVFREKKGVWTRVQVATSPSGNMGSFFADSVTSIGDLALVPESRFDPTSDPAQVHVYRIDRNGIVKVKGKLHPIQTLMSPSGNKDPMVCNSGRFGHGLGAGGDTVAIADPCDSSAATVSGVVHIYRVNEEEEEDKEEEDIGGNKARLSFVQTLANPVPLPFAYFGAAPGFQGKQSISVSSDLIAVGSAQFGGAFGGAGLLQDVYLFGMQNDGTFSQTDNIPTPEPGVTGFDAYGLSVTLSGDGELYIGQMGSVFEGGGRVFVYELQ